MEIQELLTYTIVVLAAGYTLYSLIRIGVSIKNKNIRCGSCTSDCPNQHSHNK
jgi:hypothetical protein